MPRKEMEAREASGARRAGQLELLIELVEWASRGPRGYGLACPWCRAEACDSDGRSCVERGPDGQHPLGLHGRHLERCPAAVAMGWKREEAR